MGLIFFAIGNGFQGTGLGLYPMRPKTRDLTQHGGPPGWLEEGDPAGVILYVMDGAIPPAFSVPYRLYRQELPSCKMMEFPAAVI